MSSAPHKRVATRSLFIEIAAAVILSGLVTFALFYAGATIAMRLEAEPHDEGAEHGPSAEGEHRGRRAISDEFEALTRLPDWSAPETLAAWAAARPWLKVRATRGDTTLFDNFTARDAGGHDRPPFFRKDGATLLADGVRVEIRPAEPRSRFFPFKHLFPFVMILVTTFACLFLFMRRVLRPLGEMARATRAMARGEFGRRLGGAKTREFDLLFRAFDEMAEKLGASFTNHRMMLGSISHDLRHFLNRMRLTVEVDVADPTARSSLVEDIDAMLGYVDRAAEALRATHGEEVYQFEPTDLSAMVDGLSREHGVPADVAPGVVVRADASWLALLVRNLLQNARSHGDEARARLRREGDGFSLEIDNIPRAPLDPKKLPLLFQPFFRGDPARTSVRGSGLGLFIVRAVADAHGFASTLEITPEGRFLARVTGPLGGAAGA